jgi:hypothetical protein
MTWEVVSVRYTVDARAKQDRTEPINFKNRCSRGEKVNK